MFVGIPSHTHHLLLLAMHRVDMALRPYTKKQYQRQFKLFLAFALYNKFVVFDQVPLLLLFLEFLVTNSLSFPVILNYISALKYAFTRYSWQVAIFQAPLVKHMLDGIKLSTHHQPAPKAVLTLQQIRDISAACDLFPHLLLFRPAFLFAFYAFLRISNLAPLSPSPLIPPVTFFGEILNFYFLAFICISNGPKIYRHWRSAILSSSLRSKTPLCVLWLLLRLYCSHFPHILTLLSFPSRLVPFSHSPC